MDEEGKGTVTIRGLSKDEEGRKRVEKVEVDTHNPDTLRYIEKKMRDKGIQRMDRHPTDGLGRAHGPPKSGHGGKYTWEGPDDIVISELEPVPAAMDPNDPNYVDDDEEGDGGGEVESGGGGVVIGEVEVAKMGEAKDGTSRIEFRPPLTS